MKRLALFWSLAVGAMDSLTGLLLIFSPALVLRLLGIAELPAETLVFLSWIGVFVAATGLSYGLTWRGASAAEAVWTFSALVRFSVAAFLVVKIASGSLPVAWAMVAAADAAVATVQGIGLAAGCWKDQP
jgi:hypothetical protein